MRQHYNIITVTCKECREEFDENEIKDPDVSIESNERGWDILSFRCPYCGKRTESARRG
jgi:hypothetical protein